MEIKKDHSLLSYNTFGIDVKAQYFTCFSSIDELEEILSSEYSNNKELILGGGSNILLTKKVDGIVLKNDVKGIELVKEDDKFYFVKAGAGKSWHQFVLHCIENNYAGVENLSLIPGNVGASPMQNIGAYGVEIKDVFHELEAFHLKEKKMKVFSLEECRFGYRESVFKKEYKNMFAITSVTYKLRKQPIFNISYGAIQQELDNMNVEQLSIQAISQAVINIRSSKLPNPKEVGNAGSFFKNPQVDKEKYESIKEDFPGLVAFPISDSEMKLAAGWLIEQCGWKGYRNGDVGCYPKQALVLVNYGNAKGDEIFDLSEAIIKSVKEKFDVELEREVNII